jgi:hypothetical protein
VQLQLAATEATAGAGEHQCLWPTATAMVHMTTTALMVAMQRMATRHGACMACVVAGVAGAEEVASLAGGVAGATCRECQAAKQAKAAACR